jgi:hypothetical protein
MATVTLPQELRPALPRRWPTHSRSAGRVRPGDRGNRGGTATWPTAGKSTRTAGDCAYSVNDPHRRVRWLGEPGALPKHPYGWFAEVRLKPLNGCIAPVSVIGGPIRRSR